MRTDRLARGKPAQAYRRRTRERILAGDYAPHVGAMLADVFAISPTFREKYVEYWDLPADFEVER
jgi:hypothetical protein